MDWDLILFLLFGGVVSSDTQAAFQSMLSEPLIACPIAGMLFGDVTLGLTIGLIFQLPYLAEIPVGARNLSFGNLAAWVTAGIVLNSVKHFPDKAEILLISCVVWGFFISWITSPLLKVIRDFNIKLLKRAEKATQDGLARHVSTNHYVGIGLTFLFGVIFSLIFYYIGNVVLIYTVQAMPSSLEEKLFLVKPVLFGGGIGAVAYVFIKRQSIRFAAFGVGLCAIILLIKYSL